MTKTDTRTETATTVEELDAMDIGRVVSFDGAAKFVYGVVASITRHDTDEHTSHPYTILLTSGESYHFKGTHEVTIHKPGLYSPSNPVIGFHNVG